MSTKPVVVFIAGCWDLFHIGHLNVIKRAAALGDFLVLGVVTDNGMRSYGKEPVIPYEQRWAIVAALDCVDAVVAAHSLGDISGVVEYDAAIRVVSPECGTFAAQREARAKLEARGVKYVVLPRTPGVSTTLIRQACIKQLRQEASLMQNTSKKRKTGLRGVWERYWFVFVLLAALVPVAVYWPRPEPEPLVFAVLPAEGSSLTQEQFAPLVEYLSDGLGTEVELMTVMDYTAVIEALKYGHADFARLSPGAYIQATDEADVEVLAVAVKKKTGKPDYRTLMITLADSGITDLDGVSLAYVDVGSTSGYLVPSTYIIKEGIVLDEEFFAGSHSAIIEAVRNGTVDVGCIADNRYGVALEEGVIAEGDFTILWESDPIPNAPVVVQRTMDSELKERLLALFLAAPQDLVEHLGIGEISYVVATDSDYDPIREIADVHGGDK